MKFHKILKTGSVTLCGSLLLSGTALGQIPSPTASYAGTMQITSDGEVLTSNVFAAPMKHRTEIAVDGMEVVSVVDIAKQTSYSFPKTTDGPMGNMAMVIDFSEALDKSGMTYWEEPTKFTKLGSDVVSGQVCVLYTDGKTTACMTADGIMMRAEGDGTKMLMTSLKRGPQPASLFTVPPGRQIMDLGAMTGGLGALGAIGGAGNYGNSSPTSTPEPTAPSMDERIQRALQNEAERETRKQVSKKTREAAGNTVAGAVGGGIVGDALGGEAGKLVGGLFGKKKKKKKKDDEKTETND